MSEYIDGFVIPVPKDKVEAYKATATKAAAIWRELGAIEYRECIGDDLEIEDQIPFTELAKSKDDETVVFAYVVYASREARDETNHKIMSDPRIAELCEETGRIFDCKRMAYGGFKTLVHR